MREIRKVLFCGRGAIGITLGEVLADQLPSHDFGFLCDETRRVRYTENPLFVNGQQKQFPLVDDVESFGKADLIVFCTKYGALKQAMEEAAPFVDENTILLSGINGILSERDLRRRFPQATTLRAIAQKMDACFENSHLTFHSRGELVYGIDGPGQSEALERVNALFERTGFPGRCSCDIVKEQYSKLMVNCALNQICAVYGCNYGQIARDPHWSYLFEQVMQEVMNTLNAWKAGLGQEEIEGWIRAVKTFDPASKPSMAQDVEQHRPTEVMLFSGTVIPLARQVGLPTPLLDDLYEKLARYDRTVNQMDPSLETLEGLDLSDALVK